MVRLATSCEKNDDLLRFCQALIAFRKAEPTVRRTRFLERRAGAPGGPPGVSWYGADGGPSTGAATTIAWLVSSACAGRAESERRAGPACANSDHAGTRPREFVLPAVARGIRWNLFVNTAAESPADIHPNLDGPPPADGKLCCWTVR